MSRGFQQNKDGDWVPFDDDFTIEIPAEGIEKLKEAIKNPKPPNQALIDLMRGKKL